MAKCIRCGKSFNKKSTAQDILDRLWIFNKADFGDLCLECAIAKFINDTNMDPDELKGPTNFYDEDDDDYEYDEYDDGMGTYEIMKAFMGDD